MSDTTPTIPANRTAAHYSAGVPEADLTPQQRAAIDRAREACAAYCDARAALDAADATRQEAVRAAWPVVEDLGPTRVAREIGEDLIGEATVRGITRDLRAAKRAAARRTQP